MRQNTAEDFWKKVDHSGGPDACWLWLASCFINGYGQFSWELRTQGAHRVAWQITYGPIPPGMFVCHRCDVPACCNPAHLFLGAPAENSADMVAKGRSAKRRAVNAKLTADDVRELRRLWLAKEASASALGRRFGVSTMAAWKAAVGKTYRDVA